MKVVVTQEDIDEAANDNDFNNSHWCPIARAVRRIPELTNSNIEVSPEWLTVDEQEFHLPLEAQAFIRHFDDHDEVEPLEFEVGPA